MFLLFFEFLGTTELMVILVAALVLFGPRKLPEISRQIGKGLAEFRKASDDFRQTWEREVQKEFTLNDAEREPENRPEESRPTENTIGRGHLLQSGENPVTPGLDAVAVPAVETHENATSESPKETAEPLRKRDWI